MPKMLRNILVIALVALAVVAVPGGGEVADLVLAVISLAFLAAIGFFAWRIYMENKLTLWSLTTGHLALLYGAVALAFSALVATSRLWETGVGTLAWFVLLACAGGAVYYVWTESRRYRI